MSPGYVSASRARALFTRERLLELFDYNPETGVLLLKATGEAVARLNNNGYAYIWVGRALLLAHRVAWRIMTGEWPAGMIDHINGVKTDNRWANLRLADHSLNAQNYTRAMCTSEAGLLGVARDKRARANPWKAAIRVKGVYKHLGCFKTAEEAHAAYLKAKAELHPETALAKGLA